MFTQPSASSNLLSGWIKDVINEITFDSSDRTPLDLITTSEILDLTYSEADEITESIAANALIPAHVEENEAYKAFGANSSMNILFRAHIEEEEWGYEIRLRAGLPSMVAIGEGSYFPRANPTQPPPEEIHSPLIKGTKYFLQEEGGQRLRVLAGPLQSIEKIFQHEVTKTHDKYTKEILIPPSIHTYAYIDEHNFIHTQYNNNELQPLKNTPNRIQSFYVRNQSNSCQLHLGVSCKRLRPDEVLISISLKNNTPFLRSSDSNTRNIILSSLVLPHLHIKLIHAHAKFPEQQYADVKQKVLNSDDDERQRDAELRLYQVSQSGCIATVNPHDYSRLSMTTFGIFDTPRETPLEGPKLEDVFKSLDDFLRSCPKHSDQMKEFAKKHWNLIRAILQAAGRAFNLKTFYQFQWDAIVAGLELEATGREKAVTIVRAPTGSGKTIVFMVNAAISSLCGDNRSTSILLFPTRILNEDMFRRLISFIFCIRELLPDQNITGGILMGTSDPLYRLILNPNEEEQLHHYGQCPACKASPLLARYQKVAEENKLIPTCPKCNHMINYMYNPKEVMTHLPDIVISTPDKLFYEATAVKHELYRYGFFGAPIRRCKVCGRAHPDAGFKLLPSKEKCNQIFRESTCSGNFNTSPVSKPIRYMGFDEVHSLYGETATYLSVFLATLERMQRVLTGKKDLYIRYETATATVANENELLEAITRRQVSQEEIIPIPRDEQIADYFVIRRNTTRHRVLVMMPSRVSSKDAFIRGVLNAHNHLRGPNPDLKAQLTKVSPLPNAWDFLLGYVFKKQDGFDLRRALGDFYRNRFNRSLNIEFLSGEAPKNQISHIIHMALNGELDLLLANLVISLGIDIQDLNHMIMFGVPRSFTEYVQTAGRTGRGNLPGHVSVILLPNYPRDVYLYRHFHAVLSDVSGYYDVLPVKSTNLHCSEQIFGNVIKALLTVLCLSKPAWANRTGIQKIIEGREKQVLSAVLNLLCNDSTLIDNTKDIVMRKYRRLMTELKTQNKAPFLSDLMTSSEDEWLIYSLRGRTNNVVRLSCSDQGLLELIGKIANANGSSSEERTDIDNEEA